ncbi:uncharacterized protein LOC108682815 [Hyalella azteca]|uniref:Uncharacterized protein LOC108682815 n=1 Tax=Hyalella azteca TaxID=294128 RepID=A0A8B7PMX2_HYAAZ|nr:uncharacterized protein LOC108682815 [Hyalella azteca]
MTRYVLRYVFILFRRQKILLFLYISLICLVFIVTRREENTHRGRWYHRHSTFVDNKNDGVYTSSKLVTKYFIAKETEMIQDSHDLKPAHDCGEHSSYPCDGRRDENYSVLEFSEPKLTSATKLALDLNKKRKNYNEDLFFKKQNMSSSSHEKSNIINSIDKFDVSSGRKDRKIARNNETDTNPEFLLKQTVKVTQRGASKRKRSRRLKIREAELLRRQQPPFTDDNSLLAERQFETIFGDSEHFVDRETNLIMDNILRTDITSLLSNPEKVEAITYNAAAVMKKVVTRRNLPLDEVRRLRWGDIARQVTFEIRPNSLIPTNEKKLLWGRKHAHWGGTKARRSGKSIRYNSTLSNLHSDATRPSHLTEAPTISRAIMDKYLTDTRRQIIQSGDVEILSREDIYEVNDDPLVVHEPSKEDQLVAEDLSTPPASQCCLSNRHVLPHNQKLREDYPGTGGYGQQVRDYDSDADQAALETYASTENKNLFGSNNVTSDGLYVKFNSTDIKSDNKTKARLDFHRNAVDFPLPRGNQNQDDEVQSASRSDADEVGGGHWDDDVWIANTDLPATSAFFFTVAPSFAPRRAVQEPISIKEITAERRRSSRPDYFLRQLVTRSDRASLQQEKSQRNISHPRWSKNAENSSLRRSNIEKTELSTGRFMDRGPKAVPSSKKFTVSSEGFLIPSVSPTRRKEVDTITDRITGKPTSPHNGPEEFFTNDDAVAKVHNLTINYDSFRIKKVPFEHELEPRYQIFFKDRALLQWDYTRPAFFPWKGIPDYCSNYAVRFLKPGSAPRTLLVSYQ